MTNSKKAYLFGLTAVACWSTVASAFKLSLNYFSPSQLLVAASLFSILALTGIVLKQGKLHLVGSYLRNRPLFYLCMGLLNPCLYYLILFKAYDLLPAQQAQPLNYTWAITLTLMAVVFLKQKIRPQDWVAIVIGYLGAFVIATHGELTHLHFSHPLGVILALLSTVIWAMYWILNTKNQGDAIVSLLLAFLLGFPLVLIANAWLSDFHMGHWQGWLGAVWVGFFEMGFTYVLWLQALRHTDNTARISNLIFISPFVSLVLLHFLVGENIYFSTITGLVLIVIALLIQQLKFKRSAKPRLQSCNKD
ncbi:DMT family transporter [Dongshaea marina]|uniref:DMT family transporter n=1 Tax=Dongshaea marina TaxID=2047966 RepID=UPI000D3E0B9B|nr:DMT family transporter [Dongshaea marina]